MDVIRHSFCVDKMLLLLLLGLFFFTLQSVKTDVILGETQAERIQILENQVIIQQTWLQELQNTLTSQHDMIVKLSSKLQTRDQESNGCSEEVTRLRYTVALQEERISQLENEVRQEIKVDKNDVEKTYNRTKTRNRLGRFSPQNTHNAARQITSPTTVVVTNDESVAFEAVITEPGRIVHLQANENIVFDTAVFNMGNGYNPLTGIFTAPTRGIYLFSTSVTTKHPSGMLQVDIEKNGMEIAGGIAYGAGRVDSHDQCSVTVVVLLEVGDRVYVRTERHSSVTVYGDRLTSFSGLIVMPL